MKVMIEFKTEKGKGVYEKTLKVGNNIGTEKVLFKTMFKEKKIKDNPLTISIKPRQPCLLKHLLQVQGYDNLSDLIINFFRKEGLEHNKDYSLWVEK